MYHIKLLILLSLFFLNNLPSFGQDHEIAAITISTGYIHEDFRWSIAGNNNGQYHPNIYSELKWRNLKALVSNIDGGLKIWHGFVLKSKYSYGTIVSGKVNDRDYLEDNRTSNIYDGNFDSSKGRITSLEINMGHKLSISKSIILTPSIGYTRSTQNLFLLGNDASSQNLRSTYDTKWSGFNASIETAIHVSKKFDIYAEFNYKQLKYKSEANWNLIPNFRHPVSFEQNANGFQIRELITGCYWLTETISINLYASYSRWKTGKGVDRLFLQDGTTSTTRFNDAYRESYSLGIGVKYRILK